MLSFPEREKKILNFWKNFNIFKKSLDQNLKNKRFNWLEGPPYTNAKPHMGHFLTRIYKDTILRFFTMLGFYAPRRAGWDTHGLPIEVVTEKEIGINNKKEIYDYGIENFNQKCKELVTQFKEDWEKIDERMGFWLDHRNAYITYDPFYMESCWWILKKIYQKGLLQEEYKVAPYCTRCETVLAQAELGMPDAYKKVKDPSIFVKFKIKNKNEYLLAWTTTPWTLPGNLALAVNPQFDYYLYEINGENIWTHQKLEEKILKKVKGKELEGISYEPLFEINEKISSNAYQVYLADFVKEDEGTGIVHIAPAYGLDDFELGRKYKLGLINYLDNQGRFVSHKIKNLELGGVFFKEAEKLLLDYLQKKNLIFDLATYEHDYPHCWRCRRPLIYLATKFWVVKISQVKNKIIENFKRTNWIPESAGHRFYEWIKEGKDWNLSRTRFWGIPLPIWKCEKCENIEVIGSIDELAKHFKAKNQYFLMRHTEALSNKKNFLSSYPEVHFNPLTRKGASDALSKAKKLQKYNIDFIFASPLSRTKETAEIIAHILKVPLIFDFRLREIDLGILNGQPSEKLDEYLKDPLTGKRDLNKKIENGESFEDIRKRVVNFILETEKLYQGKNILIISHGAPLIILEAEMRALDKETLLEFKQIKDYELGEIRKVDLKILPRDNKGSINLHRPFVDNFSWLCPKCKNLMKRVEEVADIWFDSGCAPFASYYYPRRNKKEIDQNIIFPQDFIIEGIDQTRGWFYTLLVISTLIKNQPPYKNVVATGLVLDKYGKKMSKSLGNVVDPQEIIEKYGADLPRFYLFYLNEAGDNKMFNEEEMLILKREFFDLLLNVVRFYKLYYQEAPKKFFSQNILDLWFSAKIKDTYEKYYSSMQNFNLHKASRILVDLLGDFSRWWLRRSRKRFQDPQNKKEFYSAILNFEVFLYEFLKMLAPLAPFTAEYVFYEIRENLRKRFPLVSSIHLEKLAKPLKLKTQEILLLKEMEKIRELASKIHKERKEKQIKVRQPLKLLTLKTKFSPEVLDILKEEVNVLEIKIDTSLQEEFVLDFEITNELKEIGIFNDFVRIIQDLRQDGNLTPKEIVGLKMDLPKILSKILINKLPLLMKKTKTETRKKLKTIIVEKEFTYEEFGKVKILLYR